MEKYNISYLMEEYETNQKLQPHSRKLLTRILTNYFISEKIWLKRSDFTKVNTLISEQFPKEKVGLYYNAVGPNNKAPGGTFFNCYKNKVSAMRKLKLLKYKNNARNSQPSNEKAGETKYLNYKFFLKYKLFF